MPPALRNKTRCPKCTEHILCSGLYGEDKDGLDRVQPSGSLDFSKKDKTAR